MTLFRERILASLLDRHAISLELVQKLLGWRHPGFSAHVGESIRAQDSNGSRTPPPTSCEPPFSLRELVYLAISSGLGLPAALRSKWILYGTVCTLAVTAGGLFFLKRFCNSPYHRLRTASVVLVQLVLAFLLPIALLAHGHAGLAVKKDMCISCGNCSTYCEMGIDVRQYAMANQSFKRASCVGCGMCALVCPRGVLKLENRTVRWKAGQPIRVRVVDLTVAGGARPAVPAG